MSRIKKIDDQELLTRLFQLFREYGFDGTSLTQLAEASGLKKASLYHRFPGGKEQMAEEVLAYTYQWIEDAIVGPIQNTHSPSRKVKVFSNEIAQLYDDGKKSCLLNMLLSATQSGSSFTQSIRAAMKLLLDALQNIAEGAGFTGKEAGIRAEQVLVEVQGALVVSRGLGSAAPFKRMLKRLPGILLGEE